MDLKCFAIDGNVSPKLVPGAAQRDWMGAHTDAHPYRCLPLVSANTFGWDLLLEHDIEIEWSGGSEKESLTICATDGFDFIDRYADSNFGHGILTFLLGYVFRTPEHWQMLALGPPNAFHECMVPLAGVVETDWLGYPFTMNWRLTKPTKFRLARGTPICRIIPIQVAPVLDMQPRIFSLKSDKPLLEQVNSFGRARQTFMEAWNSGDYEGKDAWAPRQHYSKGKCPMQDAPEGRHWPRIRVKAPIDEREEANEGAFYGIMLERNYLSDEECDAVRAALEQHPERLGGSGEYSGRLVYPHSIPKSDPAFNILRKKFGPSLTKCVADHFVEREPMFLDSIHIMRWEEGQEMPPHLDGAHPDGTEHPFRHRQYACIVYLNEDFEGGELWFPDLGIELQAEKGLLIALPGGHKHYHGIARITKGSRYTALCWLSFDEAEVTDTFDLPDPDVASNK